jgi:threonine/homoserine/homoserine lactone efflux protein
MHKGTHDVPARRERSSRLLARLLRAVHHAGAGHEPVPGQDRLGRAPGRHGGHARRVRGLPRPHGARALGLSALLAASETAFFVLKVVGGFYLLWLAIDAVRHGSALNIKREARPDESVWRTFVLGVGVNLTNPKVVLFFVTFLPQFVSPSDPHAGQKLLFLGFYFTAINLPLCALLVLGADRVIALLRRRPRVMRAIDYTFAGIFGAFAVKILAMPGR